MSAQEDTRAASGIVNTTLKQLVALFERFPGIDSAWLYGSRARGDYRHDSDIDLVVDAPSMTSRDFSGLLARVEELGLIYRLDISRWQDVAGEAFRVQVERDRKIFWAPFRGETSVADIGALELKDFQRESLEMLVEYVDELNRERAAADRIGALVAKEPDLAVDIPDFPKRAWEALDRRGRLPTRVHAVPYSSRFDGARRPVPNVCIKIPTGGGKTLIGAAAVSQLQSRYLRSHTGIVLWIVPNEAIYSQTKKALANRDHPYRQLLNVAGAGRVKILEKDSPISKLDVDSHLCIMLLMLQSAARQSKETLRFFRDRGSVHGFFPREDDIEGHWKILEAVPNLDVYASLGMSSAEASRTKGAIIKDSLGNVMRRLRPIVVIDEGHHSYTDNALKTIDGFNPAFILELSATPRAAKKPGEHGANILVDVRGSDLERAEMIKLPINVDVRPWPDWKNCLTASVTRLNELQTEATKLEGESGRYIRPILLIQVERTGADQTESGRIHANDAESYLLQIGFKREEIAQKTSEKNELAQPENIDLLSPACKIRAIITKQALQEGWDCPFAYVLCALAAGRNPGAMTQLLGRILRQPHVAKTGRLALDESYVYCHDAETATVVKSIKSSLEEEGMGDLLSMVKTTSGDTNSNANVKKIGRRKTLANTHIFLPRVTWREGGERRELSYDSDVLGSIDWEYIDAAMLAVDWAPDEKRRGEQQFQIGLDILERGTAPTEQATVRPDTAVDRVFISRAISDLVPNSWLAFAIINQVVRRLTEAGHDEIGIGASASLLIEQLRTDITRQRDALAESVFADKVKAGQIEFGLRADHSAYEIPFELEIELPARPNLLTRPDDGRPVEKSLFDPFFQPMVDNDFESDFACYLDGKTAVNWWHRNVAKSQYGLQGWKRNKVYPDFVFLKTENDGKPILVVMETKGAHLKNEDTDYKTRLLAKLTAAFSGEKLIQAGELELTDAMGGKVVCDLVFDENWKNSLNQAHFKT